MRRCTLGSVTRETDVADFAGLPGFLNRLHCTARGEDEIRVVEANDLMELQEVDHICLQTSERLLDLTGSGVLIPAIDLCHQKNLLPVTIAESLAHPDLADAVVVIPAVVHEGDAAIDCCAKQADALVRILLFSNVVTAHANYRDLLSCAAKLAINHVRGLRTSTGEERLIALSGRRRQRSCGNDCGRL